FSFGYVVGFGLYTVVLGYLWLAKFSQLDYDHTLGAFSVLVSGLAFLVPALFMTLPIRQRFVLSAAALDRLVSFILIFACAALATATFYNFRIVGLSDIYKFRDTIEFPGPLRYALGIFSNALLPFAFACCVLRGNRWRAAVALALMLLFYPVML